MQHEDNAGNQIPAGKGIISRLRQRSRLVLVAILIYFSPMTATYSAGCIGSTVAAWLQSHPNATTPGAGMCLKWVNDVLQGLGLNVQRQIGASQQWYWWLANWQNFTAQGVGQPVQPYDPSRVKAGDLIFWAAPATGGCDPTYGHVGFADGNGGIIENIGPLATDDHPVTYPCGVQPTGFVPMCGNAAGAPQCPAGEANLTNAIQVAQWGVKVNKYSQADRACSACTSQFPGGMPGAPVAGAPSKTGYCCDYDCSSFTTWILRQIPQAVSAGLPAAPAWPPITRNYWSWANGGSFGGSLSSGPHPPTTGKPCDPTKQPVCFGETMWDESPGPGHIVTALCGKVYGADCPGCGPDITDHYITLQPGTTMGSGNNEIVWVTPPGLDSITMVSCSQACTSGGGNATCTTPSGPSGPPPTGGAGGCSNGSMGGSASCQGGGSCGGKCQFCVGDYFQGIGSFESNCSYTVSNPFGCLGKYQFCPGTIQNYWAACPSPSQWTSSPACQDQAAIKYAQNNWNAFYPAHKDCLCKPMTSHNGTKFTMTQGAVLGGGQFGIGWVISLCSGQDHTDGNGFYESDYAARMSTTSLNSNIPWAYNSCAGGPPPGPGGGTCGPPPCGLPTLTGTWQTDPCSLKPPDQPPGQKFHDMLDKWWNNSFMPAIKDMTTELYTYRVFQTHEIARIMDAEDVTNAARTAEEQHITASKDDLANDLTCVAGSFAAAATETKRQSTALTQGWKHDLQWRAQNVTEKNPNGLPGNMTPWTNESTRWATYCKEFYDPKSNDGKNITSKGQPVCPAPTTPGAIVNGDISIENFLMQDTIDMSNPDQYQAAQALMVNLLQPATEERIPANLIPANGNVPTAVQEHIITRQHLDAINNIAADVIGSMISRRTAMSVGADPAAVSAANEIATIRKRAGIDQKLISAAPSYNEIMQAMTKERFFDPEYFFRINNTEGALKQEQASVDAYTTVELQDIYQLEEQINALLAARASLKLTTVSRKNEAAAAPNK